MDLAQKAQHVSEDLITNDLSASQILFIQIYVVELVRIQYSFFSVFVSRKYSWRPDYRPYSTLLHNGLFFFVLFFFFVGSPSFSGWWSGVEVEVVQCYR